MTSNIKTGIQVEQDLKNQFVQMSTHGGDRFIKAAVNEGIKLKLGSVVEFSIFISLHSITSIVNFVVYKINVNSWRRS